MPTDSRLSELTPQFADGLARSALACIHRKYPVSIPLVAASDADFRPACELTPVFYGCFDWHSAVHNHWLLVRVLNTGSESALTDDILSALSRSFTPENVAAELDYLGSDLRASFERPYGIAWFLQLVAELAEAKRQQLQGWRDTLAPLERLFVDRIVTWLPKLSFPVRTGVHNQSAYSFGLMIDYARVVGDEAFESTLVQRSLDFFSDDVDAPLSYEPSATDFLSPTIMTADLMRRILPPTDFSDWLRRFLPTIPASADLDWLQPCTALDRSDGQIVHLEGLNLTRSIGLYGIASALSADDPRRPALLAAADRHKESGLRALEIGSYAATHWLSSFAMYLLSGRGI